MGILDDQRTRQDPGGRVTQLQQWSMNLVYPVLCESEAVADREQQKASLQPDEWQRQVDQRQCDLEPKQRQMELQQRRTQEVRIQQKTQTSGPQTILFQAGTADPIQQPPDWDR